MQMNRRVKLLVNSPLWAWLLRFFVLPPLLNKLKGLEPKRILEVGCGQGDTTAVLAELFPKTDITATDYDGEQVSRASRRKLTRVVFEPADATSLNYPDASFDLVVEFNTFHHIADWKRAIREVSRVLKYGGAFAVIDETKHFFNPLFTWFDRPEAMFTKEEFFSAAADAGLKLVGDVGSAGFVKARFMK